MAGGFAIDEDTTFAGILADHLLTPGVHEVTLYTIEGPARRPVLRPVQPG